MNSAWYKPPVFGKEPDINPEAQRQMTREYLLEIASRRGIDLPTSYSIDCSGIWTGIGDERVCLVAMPGFERQPLPVLEILDDDGAVMRSSPLVVKAGAICATAKQLRDWSGIKPMKKAKAEKKPVEAVQPVHAPSEPEKVDEALLSRLAALEEAVARLTMDAKPRAMDGRPAVTASNDNAADKRVRSEAERRAIIRAWKWRCEARERADLDWRALEAANGAYRGALDALAYRLEERDAAIAKADDFERIAKEQAARADLMAEQAANARQAATAYKREADEMERLLIVAEEQRINSDNRASRMVRAGTGYRTEARRAGRDLRGARAEARALRSRLDTAERELASRAPRAAPAGNTIAAAFANALEG